MSPKKQGGSRAKQKRFHSSTRHVNRRANSTPHCHLFRRFTTVQMISERSQEEVTRSPGPLTPNHRFEFKARGLRDTCHKWQLFSKKFQTSNERSKDPEDRVDPQLDLSNQTKARGLLHMEREYIAHHTYIFRA